MVFAVVQDHRATKADPDASVDFCSVVEGKGVVAPCARDILDAHGDCNVWLVELAFEEVREQVG